MPAASTAGGRGVRVIAAGLLLFALAGFAAPSRAATPPGPEADTNPVSDWNGIALDAIVVDRSPGSSAVLLGIVQLAVHDTVVAIHGGYRPYAVRPAVTRPVSISVAVATAAQRVLVARVPGQAGTVNDRYAEYVSAIPDGPAKANGVRLGARVAKVILALRAGDGFDDQVPYVQPPPGPGVFEPVAPTTPVDVKLARVRPLTFASPARFRPRGPASLTSRVYARDLNEVKALGRADSAVRTPAQITQLGGLGSAPAAPSVPRLPAEPVQAGRRTVELARLVLDGGRRQPEHLGDKRQQPWVYWQSSTSGAYPS